MNDAGEAPPPRMRWRSLRHAETDGRFDPEAMLRVGWADALGLLVLRLSRSLGLLLLVIGMIVGFATGALTAQTIDELRSPVAFLHALVTPLALFVIGLAVRAVVGFVALGLAFGVADSHYLPVARRNRRIRGWSDRVQLCRAYRALRWTWAVRDAAVRRTERMGWTIAVAEQLARVLTWVAALSGPVLLAYVLR
ncbi:MAG TPA: hypothetical protein VFP34_06980 [Microlunatus sp.]|nr:hypothetical protein [Microlunatus sp.]